MIELRDYQRACLVASRKLAREGGHRGLIALPTGTGKTVIFAHYPKLFDGRTLVLAHRDELIDQAETVLRTVNPDRRVSVEKAERKGSLRAEIVVASVQTMNAKGRVDRWPHDHFRTIVVDEAHHAAAPGYLRILRHFGLSPELPKTVNKRQLTELFRNFRPASDAPVLFGYTATPSRSDNRGLEWIFDEVVYSRTLLEMMESGWLCDIRGVQVRTDTSLSGLKTVAGDYSPGELATRVNTVKRNELAVSSYLRLAAGRRALAFAVDVAHARELCGAFRAAGIRSEYVIGATPAELRRETVEAYRTGKIDVLVNCMVLTEGFDAPETNCLIMARPTKSQLLYTQMLGRGTRIAPGKSDLLVIDLVDVSKLGVPTVNTLFGLPPKLSIAETGALSARRAMDEYESSVPAVELANVLTLDEVQQLAKTFDPLRRVQVEDWIRTRFAWVKTSYGYALSLSEGAYVGVVTGHLGSSSVRVKSPGHGYQQLGWYQTVQEAISAAEDWVASYQTDKVILVDANARWRKLEPTAKQLELATRLGREFPPRCTRGDASKLLNSWLDAGRQKRISAPSARPEPVPSPTDEEKSGLAVGDLLDSAIDGVSVERALLYLYGRQTDDERSGGYTAHENGQGFSAVDAPFLTSLAEQVKNGRSLTLKQTEVARRILKRYRRQLERGGVTL